MQASLLSDIRPEDVTPVMNRDSVLSTSLKKDMMGVLVGQVRCPDEVIYRGKPLYWYESMEDSFVYFLTKGRLCAIMVEKDAIDILGSQLKIEEELLPGEIGREELEPGSSFGERDCLFSERSSKWIHRTCLN